MPDNARYASRHTIAVEQVGDDVRAWLTGHGYTLPVEGPRIVGRYNQAVERVYLTDLGQDRLRDIARNVAPVWGAEYVDLGGV